MFEKLKQFITRKNIKPAQPIVVLNDADKVYLAAMRRDDARFAYVLALVSNRQNNSQFYDMVPQTQVYTFQTRPQADAFYGTVQQVSQMQRAGKFHGFFDAMSDEIKSFNEKTR